MINYDKSCSLYQFKETDKTDQNDQYFKIEETHKM